MTLHQPNRSPVDRVLARVMGLPKPGRYGRQTVRIPLRDGVTLGAEIYLPEQPPKGILLVRGPYGRGVIMSLVFAKVYPAQGYGVLS